jgi:hypothetical protein
VVSTRCPRAGWEQNLTELPATAPVLLPVGLALALVGAALYWAAGIGYAMATRSLVRGRRDDTPEPSVTLATQEEAPDGR